MRSTASPSRGTVRSLLVALAVAIGSASPASAASLVLPFSFSGAANFSTAIDPGQTWSDSDSVEPSIPTFDPSLGPLTGWRITVDGGWSIQLGGEAHATGPTEAVSADLSGAATIRMSLATGSGFLDLGSLGPFSTSIETCAGIGSCSFSTPNAAAGSFSIDSGLLDPALLPAYALDPDSLLWTLSVAIGVTTTAHAGSGWSAIYASNLSQVQGSAAITYYYAPEPGVGALVGAGLALLSRARRRST